MGAARGKCLAPSWGRGDAENGCSYAEVGDHNEHTGGHEQDYSPQEHVLIDPCVRTGNLHQQVGVAVEVGDLPGGGAEGQSVHEECVDQGDEARTRPRECGQSLQSWGVMMVWYCRGWQMAT